jgi:hypothetical protein
MWEQNGSELQRGIGDERWFSNPESLRFIEVVSAEPILADELTRELVEIARTVATFFDQRPNAA